jgi:chemotaxis protein MotB
MTTDLERPKAPAARSATRYPDGFAGLDSRVGRRRTEYQGSIGMNNGVIDLRRAGRAGLALLIAGIGLGGCASQQSYDQLMDTNRSLTERNAELQRINQELTNENQLLSRSRGANDKAVAELTRLNDQLKQQLAQAGIDVAALEQRLSGLTLTELDADTDRALTALAAQYPDIIKYDPQRGMLRFASDLTFGSGSDAVTDNAKQSLAALARILGSGPASAYDILILGHTDTQPISSGTAQRHPTNVHLSAHRAISVRSYLASAGVPADKMMVAGWGEFRPAVPNTGPRGNTPQNRRVEIFLTRATGGSMGESPAGGAGTPETTAAPQRQPDMMK